jgi:hypothetical protein
MPKIEGVVVGGGSDRKVAGETMIDEKVGRESEVRFWSTQSNYMVGVAPGRNLKFFNHVLVLRTDDPDVERVRKLRTADVREVVDRPFKDEGDVARFNSFLRGFVYTGERGEPSKRGVIAAMGLFRPEECQDIDASTPLVADQLIVRAIKGKSFRGGI